MKKLILCFLIITALFYSCSENEMVEPQQEMATKAESIDKGEHVSARVKDPYHTVNADGTVSSVAASFVVEELYIARNQQMWAIDQTSGTGSIINYDEPVAKALASTNGYIYLLANSACICNDNLYKIDPATGVWTLISSGPQYENTTIMAGAGGYLYAVDGSTLWKINSTSGARTSLSSKDWSGAEAITALGSYVYIVDDGLLYRVNNSTGAYATFGTGTWSGIPAMTSAGSYLFAVDDGQLFKVNVNTAAISLHGNATWNQTVALTTYNGNVYGVDEGYLYKVTGTGATSQVGTLAWSGTEDMVGRNLN